MPEETSKPIGSWDIPTALAMAKEITERYGARPFAFQFSTRSRGDTDLDSKEVARSGTHFFGVRIRTQAEVIAENDPGEEILRSNMRINKWERVVTTTSGWKSTQVLKPEDVVLDEQGRPV